MARWSDEMFGFNTPEYLIKAFEGMCGRQRLNDNNLHYFNYLFRAVL